MGSTVAARRIGLGLIVALLAGLTPAVAPAPPVHAVAPNPAPGDEGGTKRLRDALEAASKGHIEAKARLDASVKRQAALAAELKDTEARLVALNAEVAVVAGRSYRLGRLGPMSTLLNSASPEAFLERAAGLERLAQRDGRQVRLLTEAQVEAARAKSAIDGEVREQQKQVAVLAQKKKDAERALATVGGGATSGFATANASSARPAPRNSDGSWPSESCTVNDPTTSGCITPRTLHALNQAKAAGFKRFASCFRSGGGGEHPKGRACDFSAATGGFEDATATGGDKTYGDNLAAFYVKNADRLGVLYVIWYRKIWMPGTGWRSYSGSGSPAADHTNHVHLSMY